MRHGCVWPAGDDCVFGGDGGEGVMGVGGRGEGGLAGSSAAN